MRERWSGGGSNGVTISSTEQRSLATNTKPDRQTDRQTDRQKERERKVEWWW